MTEATEQPEEPPPCKCGKPGLPPHPCPFREVVHEIHDAECNCCEICTDDCRDSI